MTLMYRTDDSGIRIEFNPTGEAAKKAIEEVIGETEFPAEVDRETYREVIAKRRQIVKERTQEEEE